MASTINKFKGLWSRLLPKGKAWEKIRTNPVFDGFFGEFCRLEDRADDFLLRELDPCQTVELLTDWETLVGIPDECTPDTQTLDERRAAVKERLARIGSLSASFYEQIGAFLGFDITVSDCNQFQVGLSRVGDKLCNNGVADVFRVGTNTVGDQLAVFSWEYYFEVQVPVSESNLFRVGESTVGDPLREFGNELIQCTIQKLKPAHTGVVFSFSE
jgi:uncharacterized protein YmfQ (DUF2313 family)